MSRPQDRLHHRDDLARADALLTRLSRRIRLLPRLTPENAVEERGRLVVGALRGRWLAPRWTYREQFEDGGAREAIARMLRTLGHDPLALAYARRLREVRLQIDLLEVVGRPVEFLAASRRLYRGVEPRVRALALAWLAAGATTTPELRDVPAIAPRGWPSLRNALRVEMLRYGVLWPVRREPRLVASAAIGSGEILLGGSGHYSKEEVERLAAHEVGVHVVAIENAREQPIGLFAVGTAGATRDQEGLALFGEVARGVFTAHRRRLLAARTLAVALLEEGVPFPAAARTLTDEHDLPPADAVIACERAYRGGGLTKDSVYLAGFLRVARALQRGVLDVPALSIGRVGLGDVPLVRSLLDAASLPRPRRLSRELRRLTANDAAAAWPSSDLLTGTG